MAIILWIIVGIAAALIINVFRGHNAVLNTTSALIGALVAGGGYALYFKESSDSIWHALTNPSWENLAASVAGAAILGILAQLFTLESQEYKTH